MHLDKCLSLQFTVTEVFNQDIVSAPTDYKQRKTKQILFQPLPSSLFSHEHHKQTPNLIHILRKARPGKLVPWVTMLHGRSLHDGQYFAITQQLQPSKAAERHRYFFRVCPQTLWSLKELQRNFLHYPFLQSTA